MDSTWKNRFFRVCGKTGKIIGMNFKSKWVKVLFPFTGLVALAWVLIRVIPKPSRAGYPCMQVAAPFASTFVAYVLGVMGATIAFGKARLHMRKYQIGLAAVSLFCGISIAVFMFTPLPGHEPRASENTGTYTPSNGSNNPMGTARGIMPGRVAWAYDLSACTWDGTSNYWFSTKFNDQSKINTLMKNTVCSVANQSTVAAAWDALFKYKNNGAAYVKGEKIAIKINLNNGGNYDNDIDASPQSVYAILDQLVNQFGANQSDITLCDPARENGCSVVYDYCHPTFPNVNYDANLGGWTSNAITYSASGPGERSISTTLVNTKYLITMAILKRHSAPSATWGVGPDDGNAPVTMIFKSNWGNIGGGRGGMHGLLHDWLYPLNSYHLLVDILGSKYINGKTVLNILDGLYSGDLWNSKPHKWNIAPFNGRWPSSILASQDPVALESVGIDFLQAEMGLTANADRCVREAAMANNPPSGTVYKPDGVRLPSLGVYEHWNNSSDKKYSRNLSTGNGIELVNVNSVTPPSANIALNKTATASTFQSGNGVQNGNDGNTGTRWCASSNAMPQWWKVDLGASYNLTGTKVLWEAAGRVYHYKIEVSTDNATWSLAADKTNNTSTSQSQADNFSASNARYVRITVSSVSTGDWASFFEFEVYSTTTPPAGTNIALNKAATASTEQPGNYISYGNDGNAATRWCASSSAMPQWWDVDLGGLYTISGTQFVWQKVNIVVKYKIEVSSDNATWVLKVDKSNNTSNAQTQTDNFSASSVRFVRITVTGTSASWASFYEFAVYSAGAAGSSAPSLAEAAADVLIGPKDVRRAPEKISSVKIYSASGKLVKTIPEMEMNTASAEIGPLAKLGLKEGMYFYSVRDASGKTIKGKMLVKAHN
jgi:hypothetical protein